MQLNKMACVLNRTTLLASGATTCRTLTSSSTRWLTATVWITLSTCSAPWTTPTSGWSPLFWLPTRATWFEAESSMRKVRVHHWRLYITLPFPPPQRHAACQDRCDRIGESDRPTAGGRVADLGRPVPADAGPDSFEGQFCRQMRPSSRFGRQSRRKVT